MCVWGKVGWIFDKEVCSSSHTPRQILWHKGQFNNINNALNEVDWDFEIMHQSAEEAFNRLLQVLQSLIHQYIPTSNPNKPKSKVPWKTNPPSSLKMRRARAWQQYKRARSLHGRKSHITQDLLSSFMRINKELHLFTFYSQVEYEKSLLLKMKDNPKLLHAHLRSKKKFRSSVGPIRLSDNTTTDSPLEMAECFAEASASVYRPDVPSHPAPHQQCTGTLESVNFNSSDVKKVLLDLDANSAMGPDGFHPRLLKECAAHLARPLSRIFHLSLEEGSLPSL